MKKISENMSKNSIVLQKCSVFGDSSSSKAAGSINEIPSGVGSNGGSIERVEIPSGVGSNGGSIERHEISSGVGGNGGSIERDEISSGVGGNGGSIERDEISSGDGGNGGSIERDEILSGVGGNGGSIERDEISSGVGGNGGSIESDEIPSSVGGNGDTGDTEEPAHSSVSGKETRNVVILAVSFLFLFSSYMSINNLQGSLNDEGGLGVFSLSCLFASSIVSCILSPMIITVLGAKSVLIVAFITHLVYTAANFYPRFATLFPSTLLVGALAGPFWASQGIYMTTCAFSFSQRTGVHVYVTLSRLNGIYYTLVNLSNIVGNLISSAVLYQGQYNVSVINETMYCGTNDCPRDEKEDPIADPDHPTVYILFSIFLGLEIIGLCILAICLSPIPRHAVMSKASIKESLLSWFIVLIKTDMKYLVPLQCYFAIAEEICFTEFTKSFVSCPIGIQNVGYVMAAFGGGSFVTSLLFSRLAQYTKRYVIFTTAAILQMTLIVCMYNWIPTQNDHLYIYLVATFWGVCEGLWKTQNSAMLGEHFPNNVRAVFSVKECFKSITFTITFIYSSLICVYVKLLIAMILLATSMTLYYFVENRFMQNQKRQTRWRTTTITNRDI